MGLAELHIVVHPPLSVDDMYDLRYYVRGLIKERPTYIRDGITFMYRHARVTVVRKETSCKS